MFNLVYHGQFQQGLDQWNLIFLFYKVISGLSSHTCLYLVMSGLPWLISAMIWSRRPLIYSYIWFILLFLVYLFKSGYIWFTLVSFSNDLINKTLYIWSISLKLYKSVINFNITGLRIFYFSCLFQRVSLCFFLLLNRIL